MRREAGRRPVRGARPVWERTAGVGTHGWRGSAIRGMAREGPARFARGRPARNAVAGGPPELPPENGAEVPENESSNHTRLCGALRQGAKKSGPQSGGPEQLP
jgi:hypothetical protein